MSNEVCLFHHPSHFILTCNAEIELPAIFRENNRALPITQIPFGQYLPFTDMPVPDMY